MPLTKEDFNSYTDTRIIEAAIKFINLLEGAGVNFNPNATIVNSNGGSVKQMQQWSFASISLNFPKDCILFSTFKKIDGVYLRIIKYKDKLGDEIVSTQEILITENTDYSEFVNQIVEN